MLEAMLLDVDGTLIDSNLAHAHAWVDALHEDGIEATVSQLVAMVGMGGDQILPRIAGIDAESARGQHIGTRRGALFAIRYLPHCQPQPGARTLLERLRRDSVRCVVASSAQPAELQPLLQLAGVADLIDAAATSGDARESKPEPDIIHAALARAGTTAGQAVMLGDTPYDVVAAQRAGVAIIAVRCGGWSDGALAGADAIYDDPADLLRHYGQSLLEHRLRRRRQAHPSAG